MVPIQFAGDLGLLEHTKLMNVPSLNAPCDNHNNFSIPCRPCTKDAIKVYGTRLPVVRLGKRYSCVDHLPFVSNLRQDFLYSPSVIHKQLNSQPYRCAE